MGEAYEALRERDTNALINPERWDPQICVYEIKPVWHIESVQKGALEERERKKYGIIQSDQEFCCDYHNPDLVNW